MMTVDGRVHILFVEDLQAEAELAARELQLSGLEFTWARVDSGPALRDALASGCPDLIISDHAMPGFGGLEALAISIRHDPMLPVIILTGSVNEETAVECLKAGAWDYVLKGHRTRLPFAVRDAFARRRALADAAEARLALLESERRYRTLADSGRALIRTTGLDRRCDDFNRPWLDFTGRTFEQELGDGWADGLQPHDRGRCEDVAAAAFARREPVSMVYRLRRHDGEYRSIQDDGTPRFDTRGAFLGYISHCLDITDLLCAEQDRSRLEEALVHAQRMEAVGRLASGVAHDFNNLLTGILGTCDLLLTSMPDGSPERADVIQIQTIGMRASTLTRQLLAFSRKQRLQPASLNITKLISDLQKPLRTVVRENIELAWELAPGLDHVVGDPGQIEQAVYNLAANACDAMPEGGRLAVRTSQVTLDDAFVATHPGASPGRHAAITVSDTGTGIAPLFLPLLFEPFFTTKGTGEGTGLGLAAVYGIVKQSGGYVAVESESGRGSTFTMYFPVSPGRDESPPRASSQEDTGVSTRGTETILVVEDDRHLRSLLRRVLEGYGFAVHEAVDGNDAVSRWMEAAGSVDLLLTDIVMPGRSGLEVARLLREANPALVVMFMSGYTEPALFRDLAPDDRTAIIQKPYLPNVLVEQIRQLLERRVRSQHRSDA
jgi:two-component system cell cycle sensor histidine kinase/response regulator CckA